MLYQLSYIGENQLSAISLQLSAKPFYSAPLSSLGCITSLRRTHVFTANNARTASVATRIRVSVKVVRAKTAIAAYATSAITNRFTANLIFQSPLQTWCTGKDSNLRTSLGGTDLQSVGFNHSPTCAELRTHFPDTLEHRTAFTLPLGDQKVRTKTRAR